MYLTILTIVKSIASLKITHYLPIKKIIYIYMVGDNSIPTRLVL